MKILITGATGFIGRHLVHHLTSIGHEVWGLARSKSKFIETQLNCNLIVGDMNHDSFDWLEQLPSDLNIIIHTAGLVHSHAPKDFYQSNFKGPKFFFNQLSKKYQEKNIHFINFSSQAAVGPATQKDIFIAEEDVPHPVDHYGKSKLLFENYIRDNQPHNWNITTIRPPMVIGPYDTAMLDIFKMVKGKTVLVPGIRGKEKEYSFVAVFDITHFIEKLISSPKLSSNHSPQFNLYHLAYPQKVSFFEIHETIGKYMGIENLTYVKIPSKLILIAGKIISLVATICPTNSLQKIRLTEDKALEIIEDYWCSSSHKSQTDFNFHYLWSLDKIIKTTLDDYLSSKSL